MKKLLSILIFGLMIIPLTACTNNSKKESVIIYSSSEEMRNEYYLNELKNKFLDYDIKLQYISTGNCAAKLKSEGEKIEADIIVDLESIYAEQVSDVFYELNEVDYSVYLDNLIPSNQKYVPWNILSGAIIFNDEVLKDKGLDKPTSYEDLLDPKYKGLISMPSPKSSSTGYMFLKSLVNVMGEDEAFAYFDKLTENILQYTSSGSGPVNALIQGEAAIGLGMTFQAVNEINNGSPLSFTYFEEGSPWCVSTSAIVKGHQDKPGVKEVFDFLITEICVGDKRQFLPERVYQEQKSEVKNYPTDIKYADMNNNTVSVKENLLAKWKY